jgi:hypothetical protein
MFSRYIYMRNTKCKLLTVTKRTTPTVYKRRKVHKKRFAYTENVFSEAHGPSQADARVSADSFYTYRPGYVICYFVIDRIQEGAAFWFVTSYSNVSSSFFFVVKGPAADVTDAPQP